MSKSKKEREIELKRRIERITKGLQSELDRNGFNSYNVYYLKALGEDLGKSANELADILFDKEMAEEQQNEPRPNSIKITFSCEELSVLNHTIYIDTENVKFDLDSCTFSGGLYIAKIYGHNNLGEKWLFQVEYPLSKEDNKWYFNIDVEEESGYGECYPISMDEENENKIKDFVRSLNFKDYYEA